MKCRQSGCGLVTTMDVIGGKWKLLIVRALQERPLRFGELRRAVVGITEKMLIESLKELEIHGVVNRKDFHELPRRVEYSLSPTGDSLNAILTPLCRWGCEQRQRFVNPKTNNLEDIPEDATRFCGGSASPCCG